MNLNELEKFICDLGATISSSACMRSTGLIPPVYSVYRLGPVNSKTVNPKFHLNQTFYLSLLFHV